jgi:hypothetical protein
MIPSSSNLFLGNVEPNGPVPKKKKPVLLIPCSPNLYLGNVEPYWAALIKTGFADSHAAQISTCEMLISMGQSLIKNLFC